MPWATPRGTSAGRGRGRQGGRREPGVSWGVERTANADTGPNPARFCAAGTASIPARVQPACTGAPTCGGQRQLGVHDVAEQPLLPMLCMLPLLSMLVPCGRRFLHAAAAQVDHLQFPREERNRANSNVSDRRQPAGAPASRHPSSQAMVQTDQPASQPARQLARQPASQPTEQPPTPPTHPHPPL